ncbi:MAG: hypothetical protein GX558_10295 [Clostridiales bacterium]|nr:hypothetical protein [Clostridiales bacterium]
MLYLYHYFSRRAGPFKSLSALPADRSQAVLDDLRRRGEGQVTQRQDTYMARRYELEGLARRLLMQAGGRPRRLSPHSMVLGECQWLASWYPDAGCVRLPLAALNPAEVSFTYGDLFPTFSPRCRDGREYRGRIYLLRELLELVDRLGLPQHWNPDGALGPERYIEAQVWTDAAVALARPIEIQ